MSDTITLKNNRTGQSIDLPILDGSLGPSVVDIRSLYAQTGMFTFDPGFTSTASCESALTFIDGEKGQLEHRGYSIDYLAKFHDFIDVAYLLWHGDLPEPDVKTSFVKTIKQYTMVNDQLKNLFRGYRRDAHPMAIMVGSVGALSSFYHDSLDISDPVQREVSAMRMIAKIPTLAAMAYKYTHGQPFIYPRNEYNYAENFLYMMFSLPVENWDNDSAVAKAKAKAMDRLFILHADHEQNASTSTVRLAGSSGANPFACIASGIASLWGPAHGGANEAVLKMLGEIGSKDRIPEFIEKAKDKSDPFRLMGFGHRVYKNYDPRAAVMRESCHEVLNALDIKGDPLLDIAVELERIALEDSYFQEKKLFPNVDFYSGIVLKAMGFPISMFTVLFAVARTTGWISHWNEMMKDPSGKIGRPRQLFTGEAPRDPK